MLRARSTSNDGTRSRRGRRSARTAVAALDRIKRAGVDSAVPVHHEVGVGGLEQGVVLGGLDVPLPGIQDLPGRQRLVNRIGRGDDSQGSTREADAAIEEVGARRGHDPLVEVGAAAVVAE